MPKTRVFLLFILLTITTSVFGQLQAGSPWPRAQGGNSNSGLGVAPVGDGALVWNASLPSGDNFAGNAIIAADGTIYVSLVVGGAGEIAAYSPNGNTLWTLRTDIAVRVSPAIGASGTLYVVGKIDNETSSRLLGVSPSGAILFNTVLSGDVFPGCPAIGSDGTVYVPTSAGNVDAFSSTGTELWSTPVDVANTLASGPGIGPDGVVYVGGTDGKLFALSGGPTGGTVLWSYATGDTLNSGASPSISANGGEVYLAGSNGGVYAVSGGSTGGSLLWSQSFSGQGFWGCPAIGSDGTLYEVTLTGEAYALSGGASGGAILWSYALPNTDSGGNPDDYLSTPAVTSDGSVYFMDSSLRLVALSGGPTGGTLLWNSPTTGQEYRGQLAIGANGTVIICAEKTDLRAFNTPASSVASVSVTPSPLIAPIGATGTVTLNAPAPAAGWVVNFRSSSSYAVVPPSVTVAAGQTTATFSISTNQPPTATTCTITAADAGSSQTTPLVVYGDYVTLLSLSPATVGGGGTSTGTVTLYEAAPAGGYVVNLSTEYPSAVGVPASVTVPAGATSADFTITTKQFPNSFTCDIYAGDGTSGAQKTLTVNGVTIFSMSVAPNPIGCNQTSTGTITLTSQAPSAGWVVNLSDEYPGSVSVPATVTILAGQTSATFTITPLKQFSNTFECDIYASDGHSATQQPLMVAGDILASVTVPPSPVVGGNPTTGTVTLNFQAPPGGWIVNLSTQYPSNVGVPAKVTVPAGQTSATFTITTKTTSTSYGCGIYASDGVSGKQTTLTITPS